MNFIKMLNLNKELEEKLLIFFKTKEKRIDRLTNACHKNGFGLLAKETDLMRVAVCVNYLKFTYEEYQNLGIYDEIFIDTIRDITVWCENNGNKGLKNYNWIKNHLNCELFKIGRLQYQFFSSSRLQQYSDKLPFSKNENVIYVHIPQGEKLDYNKCVESLKNAVFFFKKHFPDYNFEFFFSESWLLFEGNKDFMQEDSNILKFQTLFSIVENKNDDAQAIERIFSKRRIFAKKYPETTTLQRNAKAYIMSGNKLGIGIGIINKNDINSI